MDLNIFPLFICKIPNNYSFQRIFDFSFEIDHVSNAIQLVEKVFEYHSIRWKNKKKDTKLRKKRKSVNQTGQQKKKCWIVWT